MTSSAASTLSLQDLLVEEVGHADADPVDLVGVRRTDAASGRADLLLAQEPLGDLVDRGVVRRDHVGVGADHQLVPSSTSRSISASSSRNSASGETTTPLAMTEVQPRGQDAAGQQVGGELLPVDHDGVAGVVPAAGADAEVDRVLGGEQVGRLALALVTPLGSEYDDRGHVSPQGGAAIKTALHRTGATPRRPTALHLEVIPTPRTRVPLGWRSWTPSCSSPTSTPEVGDRKGSTLPWACSGRTPTSRSPSRPTPASSTACSTGPVVVRSWSRVATAACTRSSRRCTGVTSSPSAPSD